MMRSATIPPFGARLGPEPFRTDRQETADAPRILLGLFHFGQSYMHVPAMLARSGFRVDAVATPKHPLRRSRWLADVEEVEEAGWAATIEEKLASGSYAFFANVDEPGLIALYRHRWGKAARRYLPFDPDSDLAKSVGCKSAFYDWCERNGVPIPETFRCDTGLEVKEVAATLSGRWLLKGSSGMGGQMVWVADKPRDMVSLISRVKAGTKPMKWLVQKHEGGAVGAAMFLAIEGELLAWFAVRKNLCLNGGLGPTVMGSGDIDVRIGELCAAVAKAGRITGITGLDYVVSSERGPLVIDSHLGRMTTLNHFDHAYGVDFSSALKRWLGRPSTPCVNPRPGPDVLKVPELLEFIIKERADAVAHLGRSDCKAPIFPKGDIRLGIVVLAGVCVSALRVRLGAVRQKFLAEWAARTCAVAVLSNL